MPRKNAAVDSGSFVNGVLVFLLINGNIEHFFINLKTKPLRNEMLPNVTFML